MEALTQKAQLPRPIWALGFVSLLMDFSSELILSLLPIFIVVTLGASSVSLGWLEGIAQATASVSKMLSGALSDWLGKRKFLAVIGYGLSALTKPLFPLAASMEWVFAARILDRVGKGIRGAPRDALVGAITPPGMRGQAYGLRQALDTIGAVLGPGSAIILMLLFSNDIRLVYWFAVIPAFLCVALLIWGVEEPERKNGQAKKKRIEWSQLFRLSRGYWGVVSIGGVLTLARFSEAFLVLRAQNAGLSSAWVPSVMVVMNIVYALCAWPAGALSDRMDRRFILMIGTGFLILADLVLGFATSIEGVMIGVSFWGLHMGLSEGLLAALVADTANEEQRGTAFGLFNLISGVVLLIASTLAGYLWDIGGPQATFAAGAVFSVAALLGLLIWFVRKEESR